MSCDLGCCLWGLTTQTGMFIVLSYCVCKNVQSLHDHHSTALHVHVSSDDLKMTVQDHRRTKNKVESVAFCCCFECFLVLVNVSCLSICTSSCF